MSFANPKWRLNTLVGEMQMGSCFYLKQVNNSQQTAEKMTELTPNGLWL